MYLFSVISFTRHASEFCWKNVSKKLKMDKIRMFPQKGIEPIVGGKEIGVDRQQFKKEIETTQLKFAASNESCTSTLG